MSGRVPIPSAGGGRTSRRSYRCPKLLRVNSPQQLFALLSIQQLMIMGSLPQRALPVTLDLL